MIWRFESATDARKDDAQRRTELTASIEPMRVDELDGHPFKKSMRTYRDRERALRLTKERPDVSTSSEQFEGASSDATSRSRDPLFRRDGSASPGCRRPGRW